MDNWYNEGGALFPGRTEYSPDPGYWVMLECPEDVHNICGVFSNLSVARQALLKAYPHPQWTVTFNSWASGLVEATVEGYDKEWDMWVEFGFWIEYKRLDVLDV